MARIVVNQTRQTHQMKQTLYWVRSIVLFIIGIGLVVWGYMANRTADAEQVAAPQATDAATGATHSSTETVVPVADTTTGATRTRGAKHAGPAESTEHRTAETAAVPGADATTGASSVAGDRTSKTRRPQQRKSDTRKDTSAKRPVVSSTQSARKGQAVDAHTGASQTVKEEPVDAKTSASKVGTGHGERQE